MRIGSLYRGRYRLKGDAKPTEVSLGVTDEKEAWRILETIIKEVEHERQGIIPPKMQRETEGKALSDVIEEFLRSKEGEKRSHKYVIGILQQLTRLSREAGWKHMRDITRDSFERWRARQKMSPKTLNSYLITANTFLNWACGTERIRTNPLQYVRMQSVGNYEKRERRAVSWDELQKLVSTSTEFGPLYTVASLTGLRRGELQKLQWRDVQLDGDNPCIHARATTTKNDKKATLPLHPLAVDALRTLKRRQPHTEGTMPVFLSMPRIKRYRHDLEAAGIPYTDERGRVFDFHSLRNTFCTLMEAKGVPIRDAMELMRHSDPKLTTKIYTDAGHLPLRSAVLKIGSSVNTTSEDTRETAQNGHKTHKKRVFSAFDEKSTLSESDLKGMDPEQYYATDSQGNIADYALRWLGGGDKETDYEMVRDAGFEPATPAV